VTDLQRLLGEQTAGSPQNGRKWVRHSLAHLAEQLQRSGHTVSPTTVSRLLHGLGYSPKANRKRFTGPRHPDRDRQFAYIRSQRQRFAILGYPVISVDTKQKELIGNFKNPGRVWCRRAAEVNAHDFLDDAVARVIPYGLYEPRRDRGHVYVGLSAD